MLDREIICIYIGKCVFYWAFVAVFSFATIGAYADNFCVGSDIEDLGIPEPFQVDYNDILSALKEKNLSLALNLTENLALQELRKKLADTDWLKDKINQGLENSANVNKFDGILKDPGKSDEEKILEISKIIDSTFSEYSSQQSGSHNLRLQHSIELGVTRLTWDRKEEEEECKGLQLYCSYAMDRNGSQCGLKSWTNYVHKIPDYRIYKVVNGQKKLIKSYGGMKIIRRNSTNISLSEFDPWYKYAKNIYDYNKFDVPSVAQDRLFFDDMYSDLYEKGDSISYRVVSDNSAYRFGKCGSSEHYTSDVVLDANGDYMADFIPRKEYDALFAQNNAWLVPVITLLLL